MAIGSRLNVLAGALKASWKEGVESNEGSIGRRIYDTTKDTMFTGKDATLNSRIAGGAVIGAGVLAGGYGLEHYDEHPLLGTGALAIGTALLLSRPGSVVSMFGKEAEIAAKNTAANPAFDMNNFQL